MGRRRGSWVSQCGIAAVSNGISGLANFVKDAGRDDDAECPLGN